MIVNLFLINKFLFLPATELEYCCFSCLVKEYKTESTISEYCTFPTNQIADNLNVSDNVFVRGFTFILT